MSFTINSEKELAQSRRPVVLCEFTFVDGSVWRAATIACTYGGHTFEAAIAEQDIDRLQALSEQGIEVVPRVSVTIADAAVEVCRTWDQGTDKGFRGATLLLRFAVYDVVTAEWSTDDILPFIGRCSSPAHDGKNLSVSAENKLSFAALNIVNVPISERCPLLNPKTVEARATADDPDSPYYRCGETLDLATAPPCDQTNQTCTRPLRRANSTWVTDKQGEGREYITKNKVQWINPDTSGKYKMYWPEWLGGAAWVEIPVLNQWADGNYTRGEAAVGVGVVDVLRVIVNGIELTEGMTGDYRWHYVNHGARDGAHNVDVGYADGDPYGNLTAIQFLAPHATIDPGSTATVRVLGRKSEASASIDVVTASAADGPIRVDFDHVASSGDPGDGTLVTIIGNTWAAANGSRVLRYLDLPYDHAYLEGTFANGSGTGGTLHYASAWLGSGGAVPTVWLIQAALKASGRYSDADFGTTWTAAGAICAASIALTDGDGVETIAMRFQSAIALRDRRALAEVVRGLCQSIGARLYEGQTGLIEIFVEGTLAEQQGAAVAGSNYNTAIASVLRDGSSANGYAAYRFDRSNCWGLKRTSASGTIPNKVVFPFTDPAADWAVSTFGEVDPEDVARMEQEVGGGLQVQPEGIASYNFAYRCARLGLAKLLRGNSQGDTRGTEAYEWRTSFRGCRLRVGQIVLQEHADFGLEDEQLRLTAIKASKKDFAELTLVGQVHRDEWYLDTPASLANPERKFYHVTFPGGLASAPEFGVEASALDPTVAEVAGLTFAANDNNKSIASGVFEFFYCDAASPLTTLAANLTLGASSASLTSGAGVAAGDYLQVGREVLRAGAPSGGTVPITRAQLGSTADTATTGDDVYLLRRLVLTVSLTGEFVGSAELAAWKLEQALPDMRLAAVTGRVTNAYGDSATTAVSLTDNSDHGLLLMAPGSATVAAAVYTITNGSSSPSLAGAGTTGSPFQLVAGAQVLKVIATTQDVYLLLPTESSQTGEPITVKVAAGSTHSVWLRSRSGDDVEGSGSDYELADPGAVTLVGIGGGHYVITAQAGTFTAPPAADAPNVTFASDVVFYDLASNAPVFGRSGVLNLPTGDPDYSHLARIDLVAYGPASQIIPVCSLYREQFSGSTIAFKGGSIGQSGAAESWALKAWCVNEDGKASASPATSTLTVRAAKINSISTPREVPSSITAEKDTRLVYTSIGGIPVFNGNQVPQVAAIWLSEDNGVSYRWMKFEMVGAVGTELTVKRVKPTTSQTWKLAMAAGAIGGDPAAFIPAGSLPAGAVVSSGFTVGALAVPASGQVSSISVTAGAGGSFPYLRRTVDGEPYFSIPTISFVEPSNDPNTFIWRLTATDLDAAGNPISTERPAKEWLVGVAGQTQSWGPLEGKYGTEGYRYTRSGIEAGVRLKLYGCNRVDATESSFSNVLASTLQATLDVTVATAGATPDGAIPATRLDPATLGHGLGRDAASGRPKLITADLSNVVLNSGFAEGLTGWVSAGGVNTTAVGYGLSPSDPGLSFGYGSNPRVYEEVAHPCNPGDTFFAAAVAGAYAGSDGTFYLWMQWLDGTGTVVAQTNATGIVAGAGYGRLYITDTAPAGALAVRVWLEMLAFTTGGWFVANVLLRPQVSAGDGVQHDGRGGVKWRGGRGTAIAGDGSATLNLGAGTAFDGVNDALTLLLGDGAAFDVSDQLVVDLGGGMKFTAGKVSADLGNGLTASGNQIVVDLGGGLKFTLNTVEVDAGPGVTLVGNQVKVDLGGGLTFVGNQVQASLGNGLQLSGGSIVAKLGNGMTFSAGALTLNLGNGMVYSGSAVTLNLGNGLTISGGAAAVSAGNGITTSGGSVAVNFGNGLTTSGGALVVNLGNGMTLAGSALTVNLGSGMTMSGGAVTANLGSGLTTSAGAIAVNLGNGMTFSGSAVAVNAGTGLSVGITLSIANGGVGPSQISSVNISQLNAGSMAIGSGGLTFTGTGGISMFNGGGLVVNPGVVNAVGGYYVGSPTNFQCIYSDGHANFTSLQVQGGTRIDASANAFFASIYRGGTELASLFAPLGVTRTVHDFGGTPIGTVTL